MWKCVRCKSSEVKKNGHGRNNSQRFYCGACHSSFTFDGVRGTYSPEFKRQIIDQYCHNDATAKDVVEQFGISTRTLVKWKKEHQKHCSCKSKSPLTRSENKLKSQILHFCTGAEELGSYLPSPQVNAFFAELCTFVVQKVSLTPGLEEIFSSQEVLSLQRNCAQAEGELEKFRSKKIGEAEDPDHMLKTFPYYQNYQDLTLLEYGLLASQEKPLSHMLFVGGGALPLSAILLAQKWGISSTLVERDEEAVQLSRQVIQKLHLQELIQVKMADFLEYGDDCHYDVVFLAALVFTGGEAERILAHLVEHIHFDQCLIRSAEGLRQLLYTKLDQNLIGKYLNPELIVHPQNHILNSVFLYTHKS